MTISGNLRSELQLSYRLGVLRNGVLVHETPSRPHMLTDAGLDKIGTAAALAQLAQCILGTAATPTPIRRDDGAVTFTQTGNVVTASSAFFLAADVGRLFKWGVGSSGAEAYITAFISSSAVEVSAAAEVPAATAGTVWYVNTAAIVSPVAGLSWSRQNQGNGSVPAVSGDTCTVTHTCVNVSSALLAPATVTEIAISDTSNNAGVFDRDVISPPVALLTGDQAVVTIEFVARYYPVTPLAVANVATGYDSSGQLQIESIGLGNRGGVHKFDAAGGLTPSAGYNYLEPNTAGRVSVWQAAFTQQAFNLVQGGTDQIGTAVHKNASNAGYGSGTHFVDSSATFTISEAIGTIYGVSLASDEYYGRGVSIRFTTPFNKLNTQTLSFTFRKSWSRVLTN